MRSQSLRTLRSPIQPHVCLSCRLQGVNIGGDWRRSQQTSSKGNERDGSQKLPFGEKAGKADQKKASTVMGFRELIRKYLSRDNREEDNEVSSTGDGVDASPAAHRKTV